MLCIAGTIYIGRSNFKKYSGTRFKEVWIWWSAHKSPPSRSWLVNFKAKFYIFLKGDPIFSTRKNHTVFSTSIFWFWNVPILSGVFGILEEILQSGEIGMIFPGGENGISQHPSAITSEVHKCISVSRSRYLTLFTHHHTLLTNE